MAFAISFIVVGVFFLLASFVPSDDISTDVESARYKRLGGRDHVFTAGLIWLVGGLVTFALVLEIRG